MIAAQLPPLERSEIKPPLAERLAAWAFVMVLHGLLLYGALYLSVKNELIDLPPSISVHLLPEIEAKPKAVPPPPPSPPRPQPPKRQAPIAPPLPVLAVNAPSSAPAFVVAPQPPAPSPQPVVAPPAPPVPLLAARFDADYLRNPKPVYPAIARRRGEEGQVLLKVWVSAQGEALNVLISKSSGYDYLDAAALEAVRRWRFVPARRGDESVESSVIVPMTFKLE